ncbi:MULTISPECIES: phosphate-starvation-inducible PsiE family protein [Methylomonas]|uniref:phosphate-starvation-inducible PsiE family protein n=1 Tax=Methylomonas TaxID=416 RepID=UPI0009EDF89D|nr:phosphate-starvation-inducible PsiE family protein [Methylomonas koyamae]WNB76887.1 phosphate-starvation-inducible PsiE family protein [Methylomonas koyamae]
MNTEVAESATGGRSQRPPDGADARPSLPAAWPHEEWKLLSFYEKFEQCVALVLVALISLVIVSALYRLALKVLATLLEAADPTDPGVFQALFGMIMTLLIAMEFKHSILRVVARRDSIIQVKTVILIAILAISRKFIVLDTKHLVAADIAALSGALLALGCVYWLMRERDDRVQR